MLRTGLIGFGFAGRTFHAPLLAATAGIELAAITQRQGDSAAQAYPGARIFRSAEELIASDVELIVIATANPSHAPLARAALLGGKHVVIDKPMAVTAAEARELVALSQQRGVVLSVFHNRRWDGDFRTLQLLLAQEKLGRITRFTSAFDRYRPNVDLAAWRQRAEAGSGVWFDLGPHLVDQALVAFGEPRAITASIRRERNGALTDDAFDITLDYQSGLRATLSASMLAAAPRSRFTCDGTLASWTKSGLDPQESALKRGELPKARTWGEEEEQCFGTLTLPNADGTFTTERTPTVHGDYPAYYANIRDAIAGAKPLEVTPQQSLRVMELLELAIASNEQQRTLPA